MLNRTLRCLAALGATSFMGGLVGCGSPATGNATPTTSATVSLDLYDGNGLKSGSCAGTLIAADTVLTAGHCVVGKYWWQVTLPATGQTAHSSIAYTFDWQNFQSDLSHPLHHDLAVLKLDGQINLSAYPSLATSALTDGAAAMRVRPSASSGFEAVGVQAYDAMSKGFPNYYYTSIDATEQLDTGSALIDPTTNQIYGVVSGVGRATGLLYSSRVEMVADWLAGKLQCTAAATISTASIKAGISADCHDQGPPPPPPPPCDGGTSSSSSSGGSSSGSSSGASSSSSGSGSSSGSSSGTTGGSSGTTGGSSSGASSSGGSSSGGSGSGSSGASSGSSGASSGGNGTTGGGAGDGGSCGNGGGYCQGSGCGNGGGGGGGTGGGSGSSSGGNSSGGNGTTGSSSGASGSGSSSGAGGWGSSSGSGSSSGGNSSGGNGTTGSSSGASGSGSSSGGGYNGGSSSGATGGGNGTTGSSGGNGTTGSGGGDNPGCNDSTCGGCPSSDASCTDNVIDYGGSGTSGGTTPYRPY